tara:strand:+ start:4574 stop:5704 length:1131 start_codon:yes stop_codon:yes gene_type:complete
MTVLNTISFGGQNAGNGQWNATFDTQNALFLKVFGGEVFAAYEKYSVTNGKHRIRQIQSGKSAQFPFTGRTTARRFKPGSDILVDDAQAVGGGTGADATTPKLLGHIKASEKVINIDDLLIASCFIDDLDLAKSHYDYRGPFSRELGRALAHEFDLNVLKACTISALANTGASDPFQSSTKIDITGNGTDDATAQPSTVTTAQIIGAAFDASQAMDEKYVPEEERYMFVRPDVYYKLVEDTGTPGQGTAILHRDYGNEGNGNTKDGFVIKVAGMTVVKTPHLPRTDTAYDADGDGAGASVKKNPGENNDYQDDFRKLTALCWHPEAVGTVKLKDVTMESEYMIQRQGDLMVAKVACGTAGLRPECAVAIMAPANQA